ncbi:MAG: hypothetical protein ABI811_16205 [Acidobacteriota bacterium]
MTDHKNNADKGEGVFTLALETWEGEGGAPPPNPGSNPPCHTANNDRKGWADRIKRRLARTFHSGEDRVEHKTAA